MEQVMRLKFASSLTDLCEKNSSFDSGVIQVAYSGLNRNNTHISREAFEKAKNTIYNVPVVCNYDRETDTIGGHDVEVVRSADGGVDVINATDPVGVIPESAQTYWREIEEEDGSTHEYFCVDALLWKRQEAYKKLKKDGIVSQSMEITVKNGKMIDGVLHIYDFEYTALTLIGIEPCFESAGLEFSKADFKRQFEEMMLEIKDSFAVVTTSKEDDINTEEYSTEGGIDTLNEKEVLVQEYGFSVENLGFSLENIEIADLENKLKEKKFALSGQIREELSRGISAEKVEKEWGESSRYWYVDHDADQSEVYAVDTTDFILYGFSYELNGDAVTINWDSKKRKKYAIVDFVDEGVNNGSSVFERLCTSMGEQIKANKDLAEASESKFAEASESITSMQTELEELRQFKREKEDEEAVAAREEVFAKFEDLNEIPEFKDLKENCSDIPVEDLEEKCFAIRGRNMVIKFAKVDTPRTVLKVDKEEEKETEPYGGLFKKFGIK